jgi:hypothetical protein
MENKKESAVKWLINQLKNNHGFQAELYPEFQQAEEMFAGQIMDARQDGVNRCFRKGERKEITNEQYYQYIYGKGDIK